MARHQMCSSSALKYMHIIIQSKVTICIPSIDKIQSTEQWRAKKQK